MTVMSEGLLLNSKYTYCLIATELMSTLLVLKGQLTFHTNRNIYTRYS